MIYLSVARKILKESTSQNTQHTRTFQYVVDCYATPHLNTHFGPKEEKKQVKSHRVPIERALP